MKRYSILFISLLFLMSCSQVVLDYSQTGLKINASASYDENDTGIMIKWDGDFVKVVVSKGTNSAKLSQFATVEVQSSFLDADTTPGVDYYYFVEVYSASGKKIGESSVFKGRRAYRAAADVSAPVSVSASDGDYSDKVVVKWSGNVLDTFVVYRYDTASEPAGSTSRKASENLSFVDDEEFEYVDYDVEPDSAYYYRVGAVYKEGEIVGTKLSADIARGATSDAPTGVKATTLADNTPGEITVSWDTDNNAVYFTVCRAAEDGEYSVVAPYAKEKKK